MQPNVLQEVRPKGVEHPNQDQHPAVCGRALTQGLVLESDLQHVAFDRSARRQHPLSVSPSDAPYDAVSRSLIYLGGSGSNMQ